MKMDFIMKNAFIWCFKYFELHVITYYDGKLQSIQEEIIYVNAKQSQIQYKAACWLQLTSEMK